MSSRYNPIPVPASQTALAVITKLSFRRLFTMAERINWETFDAQTDDPVLLAKWRVFNRDFDLASDICLDDPDIIEAVTLMEQVGIIGPGRAAQILAGETPHS